VFIDLSRTVGGPDRPVPEKIVREKTRLAEDAAGGGTTAGLGASAAAVQASLYDRLTGALGERG
jgi:syntaxin-binding protein 5